MSEIDDLDALESGSFEMEGTESSRVSFRSQPSLLEDSVATVWTPRVITGYGPNFKDAKGPNVRIEGLKRAQLELLVAVASGANDDRIKESLQGIRKQMEFPDQEVNNPK